MWNKIIKSFSDNPRDVITVPMGKRSGVWFYVSVDNNKLYIEKAKEHMPSSTIKGKRMIEEKKLEKMLDIFYRRNHGENVSEEASETTHNQVYWYGIFSDMKL